MKSNSITFWTELYLKPKLFFKKNLRNSKKQPAQYNLASIIFCLGVGVDYVDRQLVKLEYRGVLEGLPFLNNWFVYWPIAIISGFIGGYLLYLVGGWFFNVRLKWSKGTSDLNKSRYIFLYSGVVSSAIIILITLISMTYNSKPYDLGSDVHLWDLIASVLLLFFAYYDTFLGYIGVRSITDADKLQSVIWFLVLPFVFQTVVYIIVFSVL